jgi:hypothetical protein
VWCGAGTPGRHAHINYCCAASAPTETLEHAVSAEAIAASAFDHNGQGLVKIELDGQVLQLLGTLIPEERGLGIRVRAGDRLRVEDVDDLRNRCFVSLFSATKPSPRPLDSAGPTDTE